MVENSMDVVAAIPARWASSRFPGKALAPLEGVPMIAHVVNRALSAETVGKVLVATDDERILTAAREAGADAEMTGKCSSGTDRIAQVLLQREDWSIAVNIQGDEPMIPAANIDTLVNGLLSRPEIGMATLCRPLSAREVGNPNSVKVVRNRDNKALYFSRSVIPFARDKEKASMLWSLHLGIYAFRREALKEFVGLPPSRLEQAEALEQLRALENGIEILVLDAPYESWGVDTPEDLERVEAELLKRRLGGETEI